MLIPENWGKHPLFVWLSHCTTPIVIPANNPYLYGYESVKYEKSTTERLKFVSLSGNKTLSLNINQT